MEVVELAEEEKPNVCDDSKGDGPPESLRTKVLPEVGKRLVQVLLTGSALVGFVALAGSAVLWSRFQAIDVPPDQVVSIVPEGEAIAIGSTILIVLGLFGALATLTVYLVDRSGRATPGMSRVLLTILTIEAGVAIAIASDSSVRVIAIEVLAIVYGVALWSTFVGGLSELVEGGLPDRRKSKEPSQTLKETPFFGHKEHGPSLRPGAVADAFLAAAFLGAISLFALSCLFGVSKDCSWIIALAMGGVALALAVAIRWLHFWRHSHDKVKNEEREQKGEGTEKGEEEPWGWLKAFRSWLKAARGWPKRAGGWLKEAVRTPGSALRPCREAFSNWKAEQKESDDEGQAGLKPKPPLFRLSPIGDVFIVLLAIVALAVPSLIVGEDWLAISLGALFLIGAGLWRIVGFSEKRFFALGLAVFISVPLFGAIVMTMRNLLDPQVQAMALIRKTDGPDEAIQGIYVSETSNRIYFANVATKGCAQDPVPGSGRLLWVPKKEVVAMSVGPLQDLGDARKSALEMAYALTPSVETPAAGAVSLTPPEEQSTALLKALENKRVKEVEEGTSGLDQRLQNPGPAVRPSFGAGLSLVPEVVSPGRSVELRLSAPSENSHMNGFGEQPSGRMLRLNGAPITPVKEKTGKADLAEYVKTESGTLLRLDKRGEYGLRDSEPYELDKREDYSGPHYVKLDEDTDAMVPNAPFGDGRFLRVKEARNGYYHLTPNQVVELKGEKEILSQKLFHQAWSNDRIRFKVPDNASSGVITVECRQLAGSPLLRVAHPPKARIVARMRQNSPRVILDSHVDNPDKEEISLRWKINGRKHGHREQISLKLSPRFRPYPVTLTVKDKWGNSDSATLRLMRLPTAQFEFDDTKPKPDGQIAQARKALEESVRAHPPTAIELDGHADQPGSLAYNMRLSMERDEGVRKELLRPAKKPSPTKGIPVREVGFGETCPVDPRPGRRARNRRVDVFVLEEGVTVKPAKGCLPREFKKFVWHPRPPANEGDSRK